MTNHDKKIMLIMPPDFDVYMAVERNLQYVGFRQVVVLAPRFKCTFKVRLLNFIQKRILGNKKYKKRLIAAFYAAAIDKAVRNMPEKSVDYAIVIRPDKIRIDTIRRLNEVACKVVGYQWDGLDRFPKVFEVIPLFERFFVFDPNDVPKYKAQFPNLLSCTNFYFDFPIPGIEVNAKEVMYAGVYFDNRVDSLMNLINELEKYGFDFNVRLFWGRRNMPPELPHITFSTRGTSFLKYLESVQKAGLLIDIKACEHDGLSFRVFEAIKYSKKLITDNASVKRYDFYRPENIFVVENGCFDGLSEFLTTPNTPLREEIIQKYSFTNWLRYALDIPPYQTTDSKA